MSTAKRVPTTVSQLKPNQMFTRPGGNKVFIFECNKRLLRGNKDYVYLYYSLDNPHDSRSTTNGDKKVDLLIEQINIKRSELHIKLK